VEKLRELRGGHLQLKLSQHGSPVFSAIAFGMANAKKLIERQHKKVSIAFEPIWNVYNGRKSIQLLIKDIGE
jgi:single-stranded-DNA-specific exonuclease